MPVKESYADRVFTTSVVEYPEITHIDGKKDFSPVIRKALELGGYKTRQEFTGINGGHEVTTDLPAMLCCRQPEPSLTL